MAEFTRQALHDYIELDPNTIGYKEANGDWKGDAVISALINDPALGSDIERQYISPQEIIEQITITDWLTIGAAERLYLQLLPSLESISTVVNGTEVRDNLLTIFTAGMTSRTNLIGVVQRPGSEAEVEWGENTFVSIGDVAWASNL